MLKKKPLTIAVGTLVVVSVLVGTAWAFSGHTKQTKVAQPTKIVSPTKKPLSPVLEIFEAPVTVKLPNAKSFVPAKNKQIVPEGTQIQTGPTGRAQIVFPAGTVTRIDNNGLIKISKAQEGPENIVITILQGRVWSRIKKLLGNESYQTETSNLVAAVRGTSYGHGLVEGGFDRGTVFKGNVLMTCKKTKESMNVIPDKKALVNCEKRTGLVLLSMDEQDNIDQWLLFNKNQDIVLDQRFGKDTYDDDEAVLGGSISITPRPTIVYPTYTPIVQPTNKPEPTHVNPSNTPEPSPTNKPTDTPVPASPTPTTSSLRKTVQ